MRLAAALLLLPACGIAAEPVVVDFEQATLIFPDERPNRVEQWVEKGVTFKLAHEPRASKGKGLVMFFPHLASGHKGILCAMALEPIPVQATFPKPVSSVSLALWGSTGTPALLEAFDAEGKVVDRVALESVPGRKAPGDPIPIFNMTVKAPRIAYVQFSGPRQGEYLAADEVRFTPIDDAGPK
ncbi:MAG: hypothetical protein ABI811_22490 [Acidobacteriota bacterium]